MVYVNSGDKPQEVTMSRETLELVRMRDMVHGGLVRDLRIGAGLTLAEVARAVGVTAGCVHHWERGLTTPRGEAAVKYARLLLELESLARR